MQAPGNQNHSRNVSCQACQLPHTCLDYWLISFSETKHAYSVRYSSMQTSYEPRTELPLNAFFSVGKPNVLVSIISLLLHWSSFLSHFTLVRWFLESVEVKSQQWTSTMSFNIAPDDFISVFCASSALKELTALPILSLQQCNKLIQGCRWGSLCPPLPTHTHFWGSSNLI